MEMQKVANHHLRRLCLQPSVSSSEDVKSASHRHYRSIEDKNNRNWTKTMQEDLNSFKIVEQSKLHKKYILS